ncbi:unnamed protein product [Lota lota]
MRGPASSSFCCRASRLNVNEGLSVGVFGSSAFGFSLPPGAYLAGAYLAGAYLPGAYLAGAYLAGHVTLRLRSPPEVPPKQTKERRTNQCSAGIRSVNF